LSHYRGLAPKLPPLKKSKAFPSKDDLEEIMTEEGYEKEEKKMEMMFKLPRVIIGMVAGVTGTIASGIYIYQHFKLRN
jgi:hypothetical protein